MPQQSNNCVEYFEFRRGGRVVEGAPLCGVTLQAAGSMRFRWNETNPNRNKLSSLGLHRGSVIVPIQLDHTHIVYNVKEAGDTAGKIGDGIITTNKSLVPSVTVADCMSLYLYEPETGVFGERKPS